MTLQEMFDVSTRGIIAQGGPSTDRSGQCMYRGPNGRKCAVGHLIPDRNYSTKMEGESVYDIVLPRHLYQDKSLSFLEFLQNVHDVSSKSRANFFKDWKKSLSKVADIYDLDPKVLEEIPCE